LTKEVSQKKMIKTEILNSNTGLDKIWTKDFVLINLSALCLYLSYQMLLTILPTFTTSSGGGQFAVGLIISLFTIASLFTRPLAGNLIDRVGRKPVLFIGLLLFTVCVGSYYSLATINLILALRLLHGVSWGITSTSIGTTAADLVPKSRYGEGLGYFGLSSTFGMAFGPNLGIITMNYSLGLSFALSFALGVASLLLLNMVNFPVVRLVKGNGNKAEFIKNLWAKEALAPGLLAVFLGMTYGGITSYITLFAKEQSIKNIGLFFLCNAAMVAASRLFAGKIFDRKGPFPIIFPSILLCIIGLTLLSFASSTLVLGLAGIFYGAGFGLNLPTLQAWAVAKAAPHRKGAATGTYYSAIDLGVALGSLILGLVAKTAGYAAMYLYSNIFLVFFFVICCYYYLKDNRNSK
jgi:predicted MFS family arabinose efflux permease